MKRLLYSGTSIAVLAIGFFLIAAPVEADYPSPPTTVCCCDMTNGKKGACRSITDTAPTCSSIGSSWVQQSDMQSCVIGPPAPSAGKTCDASKYTVSKSPPILPKCTACGDCGLEDFLQLFVNLYAFGLQYILAPLAVLMLVIGAILLLTASGYQERIERGRTMISQTIAGVIIVLISWVVIDTTIYLLTGKVDRMILNKKWYTTGSDFSTPCYIADGSLDTSCSGVDVKTLQENLKQLGYTVKVDSLYGSQTAAAVTGFQTDINSILTNNGAQSRSITLWNVIAHTNWRSDNSFNAADLCDPVNGTDAGNCFLPAAIFPTSDASGLSSYSNQLSVNGIADASAYTLAKLFATTYAGEFQTRSPDYSKTCYITDRSLDTDCSGRDVTTLQDNLHQLGYGIITTGLFDAPTKAAVTGFQTNINSILTSNGAQSCSITLWNFIAHTNWLGDGSRNIDDQCDPIYNPDSGNCLLPPAIFPTLVNGTWTYSDQIAVNGIADTSTYTLANLFATTYAGEFQTRCNKTK